MTLLMDREHPEAEREMPQSLERASSRVYISELWKLAILIQHPSKFLLNCECLEGNRNTYYPKHTYAHDQAKKAKERKRPGKSPDGGKGDTWVSQRKGEESTLCVYPPLLIPLPCFQLFWMHLIASPLGSING